MSAPPPTAHGSPQPHASSPPTSSPAHREQTNLFRVNTVLNDIPLDPARVNIAALEGVSIPTPYAAEITHDAIHAATMYYDLFFEEAEADASAARSETASSDGSSCASGSTNASSASDMAATQRAVVSAPPVHGTDAGSSGQPPAHPPQSGLDAMPGPSDSPSPHHHHHHRSLQRGAQESLASPANVRNTNYHTFFPPVLTHRQRKRVIHRIIGRHHSRPFSQWTWHKAEEYHLLHARTVAQQRGSGSATLSARGPPVPAPASTTTTRPSTLVAAQQGGRSGTFPSASPHAPVTTEASPTPLRPPGHAEPEGDSHGAPSPLYAHAHATPAEAEGAQVGELYRSLLRSSSSANVSEGGEGGSEAARLVREAAAAAAASPLYRGPARVAGGGGGVDAGSTSFPRATGEAAAVLSVSQGGSPVGHVGPTLSTPSTGVASSVSAAVYAAAGNASFASAMAGAAAEAASAGASFAAKSETPAVLRSCPLPSSLTHGGGTVTLDEESAMYTIPASQQGPEYFAATAEDGTKTLIIVMVGLPARGKTFMAQKIARLLGWHGTKAKVQNIQVAWRRVLLDYEVSRQQVEAMRTSFRKSQASPQGPGQGVVPDVTEARPRPTDRVVSAGTTESESAGEESPLSTPNGPAGGGGGGGGAPCLCAGHFERLLTDPDSVERRLYRQVLRGFATDCKLFFDGGGEVVIVNDDFITEDLRDEAERLFKPLAGSLVYMEVMRDAEQNRRFNACKVKDQMEYPKDRISQREARRDFDARLELLERMYEPLTDAKGASGHGGGRRGDRAGPEGSRGGVDGGCPGDGDPRTEGGAPRRPAQSARSYIKISNSDMIEAQGIHGYLASRIIAYVMNLSQVKIQHPIYFVRHGQSCYNLEDRIGGNPLLTEQGMRDAAALLEFMDSLKTHLEHLDSHQRQRARMQHEEHVRRQQQQQQHDQQRLAGGDSPASSPSPGHAASAAATAPLLCPGTSGTAAAGGVASAVPLYSPHACVDNSSANNLEMWTSQLRRAIQTAELSERLLNIKTLRWSSLNEIHAGVCEDMTYAEVREQYPLIEHFRKRSKYTFRYPEGESYQDLVVRLEPVIMELENADKVVVVVAHQAVLRCLLAYFGSTSAESSIRVEVPHRTVWRCTYDPKGIASLEELKLDNKEAGFQKISRDRFTSPSVAPSGEGAGRAT